MRTVVWQTDFQYESSVVDFVNVPEGARPLFDMAQDAGAGYVIADIEGSVVLQRGPVSSFGDWCHRTLRGRTKHMTAARSIAMERGWMPTPKKRTKA